MANVSAMGARKTRRAWGTGANRVPFYVEVDPAVRAWVDGVSADLGAAKWAVLEALIRNVEYDASGRPTWWRELVPGDEEELPLYKSA